LIRQPGKLEKTWTSIVAEEKFPKDYATFIRYHTDLKKIPARFPVPEPLTLDQLDGFLERFGDHYPVRWS
jgi:hypothetical protein